MTTTWNPSDLQQITLSGGNLIATSSAGGHSGVRSIDRVVSGKYYWEVTCTTFTNGNSAVGIAASTAIFNNITVNAQGCCLAYKTSGAIWLDTVSTGLTIGAINAGAIICFALDMDNGFFWMRNGIAGNWNGNAANSPTTPSTGLSIKGLAPIPTFYALGAPITVSTNIDVVTANFGATAFSGTVPTGFTSGFPSGTIASNTPLIAGVVRDTLESDVTATAWMGAVAREALINSATAVIGGIIQEVLSNTQTVYIAGMAIETLEAGSSAYVAAVARETLRTLNDAVLGGQTAVTISISM